VVSYTSRPLYLREKAPGIQWIGGWIGPRYGLDAVKKNNKLSPAENRTPTVQLISSTEMKTPENPSMHKFYEEFSGK
jgi:hypothetical protein